MLPKTTIILAELIRVKGVSKDRDLYDSIKKILSSFNNDISYSEFNKALMALEIRGFIRVESIRKGTRMIYLVKEFGKTGG